MNKRRTLVGIIAVLIIGAGLGSGVYLSMQRDAASNAPSVPEKIEPNFNTYEISPPSRGALINSTGVTLSVKDGTAYATLPKDEAAEVKTGQRVLLYDAQGEILERLGAVSAVALKDNGMVDLSIELEDDSVVSDDLIHRGKIVTANISAAPRLPLSAVVRKDSAPYLWEANPNKDGTHTAYFKRANIVRETEKFVVIGDNPNSSNLFLLNPDNALRDGQVINVKKILYAGPELTEEGRILQRIRIRKESNNFQGMGMSLPLQSSDISAGCVPDAITVEGFIAQIRSITEKERMEKASGQ